MHWISRYAVLVIWLVVLAASAALVASARYATDLSAFLPRSPTPAQQLLVDQLRDGVVSRLILIGISGESPDTLARVSRNLGKALRTDAQFVAVHNGGPEPLDSDRKFVFDHRYVLSNATRETHFSAPALRASLEDALAALASPAGLLTKELLPADPTGEVIRLIDRFAGASRPQTHNGVWFDDRTALALVQTRAAGFDIDAQEQAVAGIRGAFAEATKSEKAFNLRIDLAGPGVYSVSTRATIKSDAIRFSTIATALVTLLLLLTFRSPRVLALALVPLITGALCGIAAVSLWFGEVHGITLGFGATLIGEAVDYAIYLFMQTEKGHGAQRTLTRIWPTLRLGVLTSIVGFSAMLLSGFPGLSQLGLFSMSGLIAAVLVTRFVLPRLMPADFEVSASARLSHGISTMFRAAARLRWIVLALVVLALALIWRTDPLWSDQLSSLSPVPIADQQTDERLRRAMGVSDVRHLVVVRNASMEGVLATAEALEPVLDAQIDKNALTSYDSPSKYLPSASMQQRRQANIPPRRVIEANLAQALDGLPFRANTFTPFLDALDTARQSAPLDRAALDGTQLQLKFDSLMLRRDQEWFGMIPLSGVTSTESIATAIDAMANRNIVLLDTKIESDRLYAGYRHEAGWLAAIGAAAIVILLLFSMRSAKRLISICAPLAAAVIATLGILLMLGHTLTIFHLVGALLVVAVGSNYALFFDSAALATVGQDRTALSLALANLTTVLGFGLLGLSTVPVLAAIGSTVGIGAFLSLVFAAAFAPRAQRAKL